MAQSLLENPLFTTYAFYSSILVLKMLLMSILTAKSRFQRKAFANEEDAAPHKLKVRTDENVERVRRAHLNDLENISVFFVISLFYILTNPSLTLATNLFRIFTVARIAHTIVYAVYVIPQPARALGWGIGYAISAYMAVTCILHFA